MNVRAGAVVALLLLSCASGVHAAPPAPTAHSPDTTRTKTMIPDDKTTLTYERGCIARGPRHRKRVALEFTGGDYADGAAKVLDELDLRGIKGSFFLTGGFLAKPEFRPHVRRMIDGGHYLGPHSDAHPLYATWDEPPKLTITRADFDADLDRNMAKLVVLGVPAAKARYFIPPYEHWTLEISAWTAARGMTLINMSRGTRSHTDYMEDDDPRFVTADDIAKSILDREAVDPDGLNGFLLLLHVGASLRRTRDHGYDKLGGLIDELARRGYSFVRIDDLIEGR